MRPNLIMLRRHAETTMTCTGTVRRVTGYGYDPETGRDVTEYEDVYTGRMLVYPEGRDSRQVEVVSATFVITRLVVLLPAGAPVQIGNQVIVTSSPDAPELEGITMRVADAPLDGWAVARQCVAELST